MKRVLRWIGFVLLAMLLLAALLFSVARLSGPAPAQRDALALLEAEVTPPGRNAFAWLWLLDYDVPESQWESITAEDVARAEKALARQETGIGQSVASVRFERLIVDADEPPHCAMREGDCLAMVRAEPAAYAQRIEKERSLLDKARALPNYGHYRSLFPSDLHAPIPRIQGLGILATANALDFVEGRTEAALAATCRETMAWRRLSAHGDSLIIAMVGAAMTNANIRLFAQMLAELPHEYRLPADCAVAFDPVALPFDLCPAMRGEAGYSTRMLQLVKSQSGNGLSTLLYDVDGTRAMLAPTFAHACTEAVRQQILADTPIPSPPHSDSLWRLECVGNLVGCSMADIAAPAYVDYLRRVQDVQAMLRVMHLMLELRAAAEPLTPEGMATRLESEAAHGRRIALEPDGKHLSIELHGHSDLSRWQAPLPASQRSPSGGGDVGETAQ